MCVFEGRLMHKTKVAVEPESVCVVRPHQPEHLLHAQLQERVCKACPEVGPIEPFPPWDSCHMHTYAGAVPVVENNSGDQSPVLSEPDCVGLPGNPINA